MNYITRIPGEKAIARLAAIGEAAALIAQDATATEAVHNIGAIEAKGKTKMQVYGEAAAFILPVAEAHGEELWRIVAQLLGEDVETVKAQPFLVTAKKLREVYREAKEAFALGKLDEKEVKP